MIAEGARAAAGGLLWATGAALVAAPVAGAVVAGERLARAVRRSRPAWWLRARRSVRRIRRRETG